MPDSDPLLRDRLVAVEVRQQEYEKRVEAMWAETKLFFAELKVLLRTNRDELSVQMRENRDDLGGQLRDLRVGAAGDNERITAHLQSLQDSRSTQSGAVGVLQTAASFLGGGGVLALLLAHAFGWK